VTKAKTATAKDVELNCWCIEMAMRWPVISSIGGYANAVGGQYQPRMPESHDADVISRANKIMAWVKTQH
jgi:hypothetical protein